MKGHITSGRWPASYWKATKFGLLLAGCCLLAGQILTPGSLAFAQVPTANMYTSVDQLAQTINALLCQGKCLPCVDRCCPPFHAVCMEQCRQGPWGQVAVELCKARCEAVRKDKCDDCVSRTCSEVCTKKDSKDSKECKKCKEKWCAYECPSEADLQDAAAQKLKEFKDCGIQNCKHSCAGSDPPSYKCRRCLLEACASKWGYSPSACLRLWQDKCVKCGQKSCRNVCDKDKLKKLRQGCEDCKKGTQSCGKEAEEKLAADTELTACETSVCFGRCASVKEVKQDSKSCLECLEKDCFEKCVEGNPESDECKKCMSRSVCECKDTPVLAAVELGCKECGVRRCPQVCSREDARESEACKKCRKAECSNDCEAAIDAVLQVCVDCKEIACGDLSDILERAQHELDDCYAPDCQRACAQSTKATMKCQDCREEKCLNECIDRGPLAACSECREKNWISLKILPPGKSLEVTGSVEDEKNRKAVVETLKQSGMGVIDLLYVPPAKKKSQKSSTTEINPYCIGY